MNNEKYIAKKKLPIYYACRACQGIGLRTYEYDGDFSWDTHSVCDICKGEGIFDFIENITEYSNIETYEVVNQ